MGVLTGEFSLGDRFPPGRDEKMALTQEVNDEEKDREVLWLLKEMVKKAIEEMMKEERVEYLEEHPETKGIGQLLYIHLCDLNTNLFKSKLPGFECAFSESRQSIAQEVKWC